MKIFLRILIFLPLLLAACGGTDSDNGDGPATSTATFEPGASTVDILLPRNGTVIYAESILISGRIANNPQRFIVRLLDPEGATITETTVDAQPGDWSVELPHGYSGDPTEIDIRALSAEETGTLYDSVSVLLSDPSFRPEGIFGSISLPTDGDTIGGDVILVEGRASGLPENNMIVELLNSEGEVISSQIMTLNNPFFIDEVPWQAELAREGATGAASLRIYYQSMEDGETIVLDEISLTLSEAAG